jgi:hypothetical protein
MSTTVPYAWIIDQDCSPDPGASEGTNLNAKGVTGPSDADTECLRLLEESTRNGLRFRLCYDEDPKDPDYIAYRGRLLWNPAIDEDSWDPGPADLLAWEFAPLVNFGAPNAGCAIIEFKDESGKWTVL